MAQRLEVHIVLTEEPSLVPSTHKEPLTTFQLQGVQHPLPASSGACSHVHILIFTHMHIFTEF